MKSLRVMLGIMLVAILMVGTMTCEAAKKTVAVTGIENMDRSSYGNKAAAELDAAITTILVKSGSYNVVERAQLSHVIRELGLQSTGMIAGNTAIQFGQMVGADYTVVGNIVAADVDSFNNYLYKGTKAKIKFNFKFIDNKTGLIKIAEILEGSDTVSEFENKSPDRDMLISGAANDVAQKIVAKIDEINPLSGLVVSASENQIYIDLGSDNGVKMGDNFIIYKEGNIIKHPVTGQIIAVKEIVIGSMKVVEVHPNYALCELKKSKGHVAVGDKVKRG